MASFVPTMMHIVFKMTNLICKRTETSWDRPAGWMDGGGCDPILKIMDFTLKLMGSHTKNDGFCAKNDGS